MHEIMFQDVALATNIHPKYTLWCDVKPCKTWSCSNRKFCCVIEKCSLEPWIGGSIPHVLSHSPLKLHVHQASGVCVDAYLSQDRGFHSGAQVRFSSSDPVNGDRRDWLLSQDQWLAANRPSQLKAPGTMLTRAPQHNSSKLHAAACWPYQPRSAFLMCCTILLLFFSH